MDEIELRNLKLKKFTEQDASDYCLLNNINPDNIIILDLNYNELSDISGIKLFKNLQYLLILNNQIQNIIILKDLKFLEILIIGNNKITDISVIKDFKKLKILNIENLELESDQIQYINSCKNLKELYSYSGFKDMSVLNELKIKTVK